MSQGIATTANEERMAFDRGKSIDVKSEEAENVQWVYTILFYILFQHHSFVNFRFFQHYFYFVGCQPCETKNRETVVQKSGEIFRIIKPRFFMNNLHTVSLKVQFYEFGD
jgi:hypothetical protein